jgi:hypothetical protein
MSMLRQEWVPCILANAYIVFESPSLYQFIITESVVQSKDPLWKRKCATNDKGENGMETNDIQEPKSTEQGRNGM